MPSLLFRKVVWMKTVLLAFAVLVPVAALAQQAPSAMQQRLACMSDAFRLCASSIPDKTRIRACLGERHQDLSEGCRVVYDASVKAGQ
jgi:hypothetical protein